MIVYLTVFFSKSPVSSDQLNNSVWAELTDDFIPRQLLGLADQRDHAEYFHYNSSPDPNEQNNGTGTLDGKRSVSTLDRKTNVGALAEKVQYIKLSKCSKLSQFIKCVLLDGCTTCIKRRTRRT